MVRMSIQVAKTIRCMFHIVKSKPVKLIDSIEVFSIQFANGSVIGIFASRTNFLKHTIDLFLQNFYIGSLLFQAVFGYAPDKFFFCPS